MRFVVRGMYVPEHVWAILNVLHKESKKSKDAIMAAALHLFRVRPRPYRYPKHCEKKYMRLEGTPERMVHMLHEHTGMRHGDILSAALEDFRYYTRTLAGKRFVPWITYLKTASQFS